MPVLGEIRHSIPLSEGVSASVVGAELTLKGKKGELTRRLFHPRIALSILGDAVEIHCNLPRRKEKALAGTFAAHVRNMNRGVSKGYEYRLKVVFSHFPVKVIAKGDRVVFENFLGEKAPRHCRIPKGVKIKVAGSDIFVTGIDIEQVGLAAGRIEQTTRIRKYDPRVFQDGAYIVYKDRGEEA